MKRLETTTDFVRDETKRRAPDELVYEVLTLQRAMGCLGKTNLNRVQALNDK